MVCSCSVHLCTNRSNPGSRKVHFFSFPLKNIERTQQWVNADGRKGFIPTKHSKICSDHFHQNNFEKNIGGSYLLKLKVTAIPSIFPNYSEIISKAKMQCLEVKSLKVAGCSSDTSYTKNNEPEYVQLNDSSCLIGDASSISGNETILTDLSTSNIENLLTQNSSPPRPILITPSKISCARPLFNSSPAKHPCI